MPQDDDHMTGMPGNNSMWPRGENDRQAERAAKAGAAMLMRYNENGNTDLLDKAIELLREAFSLVPTGHSDRAEICFLLGAALQTRSRQAGDVALLDEAIELQREVLALQPPGDPDRYESCFGLAACLSLRFQQTGDVALLDEVIELQREALVSLPPGDPIRADGCAILRASLHERFQKAGDVALLDEAIELEREALALRTPGHPDRSNSCLNLGSLLQWRYKQTSDISILDEAIKLLREGLALLPLGHRDRAKSCGSLGVSLHLLYKQAGDVVLLDEAVERFRETLALIPPGHPKRSDSCTNLGSSLFLRHVHTGNVALLDEAIELQREALALLPLGHRDRAKSCGSLGVSLHLLYEQAGDVVLLDEAVERFRETLALIPPGHPKRSFSCTNLAGSLFLRYVHTGDVALLDEAIELQREALALEPPGHPDRSNKCINLGASLYMCFAKTGNVALLDEAIGLTREALTLIPPDHRDRANSCMNLGSSLYERFQRTGDIALLDEAIELEREALALHPPGHPRRAESCVSLAVTLYVRYQQTGDVALLNEAMDACSYASTHSSAFRMWHPLTWLSMFHLLPGSPHHSVLEALGYLHRSFQHDVDQVPTFITHVCVAVRSIWDYSTSVWSPQISELLVEVYAKLVDHLPLMAGFGFNTASRLETLKSTRQVGSEACLAALLAEQPATAVTLLDRAHGVVWSQALHQRDPQMEGAPKDLAIELENLLRAIATSAPIDPARVPDHPQDFRHRQNTRIQAILREIRAMPGLSRFMLGSTYETLREAARDHPVVMLVAVHDIAFALIIPNSSNESPELLRLEVAWSDLRSLADTAGRANLRYRAGSTDRRRAEATSQDIPHAESTDQERAMRTGNFGSEWSPLASLWRDAVKPVLTHMHLMKEQDMDRRPRLHWCTAGEFAHVPVHAAGIYTGENQECCSDYVVSSYTPTLATLLRARKGLQPITTAEAKLLLVAAEHTADTRLPTLGKVKMETRDICSVVEEAGVQYAALSKSVSKTAQATAALPAANLVHIACHGLQHTSEPLKSAFHLDDDDVLSVSKLMELDLKGAFLAFLSACETAKGDRDQPDQAIHLAATMLFVGFKSVVATMWAMRDEDGPVVAKAFYEKLLEGETITIDAVPYALDYAVRKLRESEAPVGSWATFIHVGA